jgi:hypothetical protein
MAQDKKQLEALLLFIEKLAKEPGNEWFVERLKDSLQKKTPNSIFFITDAISKDVSSIRKALEIRAKASISYDFIDNQRLRNQLIIDNLRMENAALNLKEKESDRFYTFCVNAFYQVENITNFYYFMKFPNIDILLDEIETNTKNEKYIKNRFIREKRNKETDVSSIHIFYKINAICNSIFPDDTSFKWTLGMIRKIRNEGEHRCNVIINDKNEDDSIFKFFQENDFNSIRICLIKLTNGIKNQLAIPKTITIPKESPITEIRGIVSSKLPGACFIKIESNIYNIPNSLIWKTKDYKVGDCIIVSFKDNAIIDIIKK